MCVFVFLSVPHCSSHFFPANKSILTKSLICHFHLCLKAKKKKVHVWRPWKSQNSEILTSYSISKYSCSPQQASCNTELTLSSYRHCHLNLSIILSMLLSFTLTSIYFNFLSLSPAGEQLLVPSHCCPDEADSTMSLMQLWILTSCVQSSNSTRIVTEVMYLWVFYWSLASVHMMLAYTFAGNFVCLEDS